MILLLDLGNTSLSASLCTARKHIFTFKTHSDLLKSESEYTEWLNSALLYRKVELSQIEGAILTSVVPPLTKRIQSAVSKLLGKECLVFSKNLKTGLSIRMDNPNEVGSDLLCEALGAVNDYADDCLIIDMSSVISFTVVSKEKQFLGGALFPGLRSSVEVMWSNSAQLMDTDLEKPKRLIGKNSRESMNSGIVCGYATMIDSYGDELEQEFGKPLRRILTGGDHKIIMDALKKNYTVNPTLVFDGLYDIYEKNTKQ